MKNILLYLMLLAMVACQKSTPSVSLTVFTEDGRFLNTADFNENMSDVALDSVFDIPFGSVPMQIAERARIRYEHQLDSLKRQPKHLPLQLAQIYRRLSFCALIRSDYKNLKAHIDSTKNILNSIPKDTTNDEQRALSNLCFATYYYPSSIAANYAYAADSFFKKKYPNFHIRSIVSSIVYFQCTADDRVFLKKMDSLILEIKKAPVYYPSVEAEILHWKGFVSDFLTDYEYSRKNLSLAIEIVKKYSDTDNLLLAKLYTMLGRNYGQRGDCNNLIYYTEAAISIIKKKCYPNSDAIMLPVLYGSSGYFDKGEYQTAINQLILTNNTPRDHRVFEELACHYEYLGKHRESDSCIGLIYKFYKTNPANLKSFWWGRSLRIFGDIYVHRGDTKRAFGMYEKSLAAQLELDKNDVKQLMIGYINLSKLSLIDNDIERALVNCDKAMEALPIDINKPNPFEKTTYYFRVLDVLNLRAAIFEKKYEHYHRLHDLTESIRSTDFAIKCIDIMRLNSDDNFSKQDNSKTLYSIIGKSIGQQILRGDTSQAFWFSEKGKAQILLDDLNENIINTKNIIPDSLLEHEKNLKRQIAEHQQLLAKTTIKTPVDTLSKWQQGLINNKFDLQKLIKTFETDYSDYYRLKYDMQLADASMVRQKMCDDKTAIVEYTIADSAIYVFTLTKNALYFGQIKKPKDLEKQIENLRKIITTQFGEGKTSHFLNSASVLFDLLLEKPLNRLPTAVSHLIIVPDGVLSYIPFEILPMPSAAKVNDFRNIDFLLKKYAVSYAFSTNYLLQQMQQRRVKVSRLFAGFAPKYDDKDTILTTKSIASRAVLTREGAYELKGAKDEVKAISDLVGGNAFVNEAATEGVFRKEAERYRILHFAMHSLTDDKEPMLSKLLFTLNPKDTTQDGDLTAGELYAMKLNADLAVLSACNTGYGKLSQGEGVMSLARAFTYAGVPATVTSLWKVPDMTTREVMVEFYKNLKTGMTKDAALREAKLAYLRNAPESIAANPYFWAGFVPMGNMEAVDMSDSNPLSMWWILVGFAFILGFCWWFFKKKK